MEAWFLKQPQAIEDWAAYDGMKHKSGCPEHISEHKSIKGKDIEHLQHKASSVLKVILRQVFEPAKGRTGKNRKLEYGKLRHAPGIIAHLNPQLLMACDDEFRGFCGKVKA